jgi:hypothetical protein
VSGRGAGDGSVLLALARSAVLYGGVLAAQAGRRMAASIAGYLFAAVLFVVSLGFLTASAYGAIAQALGAVYASLIVGCVYLVAGLVVMLVLQLKRR